MKKKCYGIFNSTITVAYGIGIFDKHSINKVVWITDVFEKPSNNGFPKGEYEALPGKKAWFTTNREFAEQIATLINMELQPAFVISVPAISEDYYENFINDEVL